MNVDPNILQAALAKALTDSVTGEVQSAVLKDAMWSYLFTPRKLNAYDNKETTPLSSAFEKSLDQVARTVCTEVLSEPENKARLRTAIQAAFEAALLSSVSTEKLTGKFLDVFSRF